MDGNHLLPKKQDCIYTSCYCEENVWKLCEFVKNNNSDELPLCFTVFISNNDRVIPLWEQSSSKKEDGLVFWDYHVVFIHKNATGSLVYDLDTRLPFPCDFITYNQGTFRPDLLVKPRFKRLFRVIEAKEFLDTFASDRSHMLNTEGKWIMEPPEYLCIQTKESLNNIQTFINMDKTVGYGRILDQSELLEFFTSAK